MLPPHGERVNFIKLLAHLLGRAPFQPPAFLPSFLPFLASELPVATPDEFYMNPFPPRAAGPRGPKLIAAKRTLPLDRLVKRKA